MVFYRKPACENCGEFEQDVAKKVLKSKSGLSQELLVYPYVSKDLEIFGIWIVYPFCKKALLPLLTSRHEKLLYLIIHSVVDRF